MNKAAPTVPEFLQDKRQISEDDTFSFACHPGVPCFNSCCADVNIMLTPLDVLQLARKTGLNTRDFLEKHTLNPITKALQLPVVMLKMVDDEGKRCPFVGDEGCTVYHERPWACRMYPLGMAIPPARVGETPKPVFFLFEDDHCKGRFEEGCRQWTAGEWLSDQNIAERDEIEQGFRDLVSHPWFIGGRTLDPKRMEMFYMACYDLDTFRTFVVESSFKDRFELEPELLDALATDDIALLKFAFRWLRFALFAEPIIKVREKSKTRSQP